MYLVNLFPNFLHLEVKPLTFDYPLVCQSCDKAGVNVCGFIAAVMAANGSISSECSSCPFDMPFLDVDPDGDVD